jgi:pimeloyl-[acyl-carrier protein] methyl ester esterase
MHTVTLSGWGQPHDALAHLAPDSVAIDYAHAANASEAMRMMAAHAPERVIGWSLGGQLAVRAVASGLIKPKQLVLIATPYQFVAEDALGRETFAKFYANYKNNPRRTLHKAWELIHYEDAKSDYISDQFALFDKDAVMQKDWLRWLGLLEEFSCEALDFSRFPRTLLVHGTHDKVVDFAQSERMAARIAGAQLERWEHCGHAPHLHNGARLRKLIEEYHV